MLNKKEFVELINEYNHEVKLYYRTRNLGEPMAVLEEIDRAFNVSSGNGLSAYLTAPDHSVASGIRYDRVSASEIDYLYDYLVNNSGKSDAQIRLELWLKVLDAIS